MKKKKILIFVLLLILIVAAIIFLLFSGKKIEKMVKKKDISELTTKEECESEGYYWWSKTNTCNKEQAKITIINPDSDTRPIAVMINNHNQARPYHSGLQDAYIVYEVIVEGGITRMMAVFKDQETDRIGSVRSSRHYFLDYALENDAAYVHFGWSPQAQSDISSLGVNNINGLYDSGFWRDNSLPIDYEHRALTNISNIKEVMNKRGYRTTSDKDTLLNYSVDEIDLSSSEDSIVANNISIPYSNYMTSSYTYDSESKTYKRFANGVEHTDYITKEQYHFKNIIIIKVGNYTIDNYGRQSLNNIGSGDGYYITDGYARPIKWEKESRASKTVYKYLTGEEIIVNDGNTFIQIEPINENPSITE